MWTVIFAADLIAYVFVGVALDAKFMGAFFNKSCKRDLLGVVVFNLLVLCDYLTPKRHVLTSFALGMAATVILLVDWIDHYGNDLFSKSGPMI